MVMVTDQQMTVTLCWSCILKEWEYSHLVCLLLGRCKEEERLDPNASINLTKQKITQNEA